MGCKESILGDVTMMRDDYSSTRIRGNMNSSTIDGVSLHTAIPHTLSDAVGNVDSNIKLMFELIHSHHERIAIGGVSMGSICAAK